MLSFQIFLPQILFVTTLSLSLSSPPLSSPPPFCSPFFLSLFLPPLFNPPPLFVKQSLSLPTCFVSYSFVFYRYHILSTLFFFFSNLYLSIYLSIFFQLILCIHYRTRFVNSVA